MKLGPTKRQVLSTVFFENNVNFLDQSDLRAFIKMKLKRKDIQIDSLHFETDYDTECDEEIWNCFVVTFREILNE